LYGAKGIIGMNNLRLLVDSVWRLAWESRDAAHTEELFVPFNPWRESDLCPPPLARHLENSGPGAQFKVTLLPGKYLPQHRADQEHDFPVKKFAAGSHPPLLGRFYPKHLITGYTGNPTPFRVVGVDNGVFTADFNHPLAGRLLSLEAIVLETRQKRGEKGGECQDWLDMLTTGPGIQARNQGLPSDFFADEPFKREDDGSDAGFYSTPRLVSHVDTRAQAAIAALYSRLVRPGMDVLDLMSSWQSHLPHGLNFNSLVGLGLNEEELNHNPRLTERLTQDLNRDPGLPFPDAHFNAIICNLSVEYLVRPIEVFAEAARVLKPGGLFVQTFSQRWFPPKVVKIWTELHEFERLGLVLEYFLRSGAFGSLKTFSSRGWPRPATDRYYPQLRFSDPVYAVWGEKI
ncbi:MAG: methyltransferase domain-containing protein, partial [Desulfobaccales bacterium]